MSVEMFLSIIERFEKLKLPYFLNQLITILISVNIIYFYDDTSITQKTIIFR